MIGQACDEMQLYKAVGACGNTGADIMRQFKLALLAATSLVALGSIASAADLARPALAYRTPVYAFSWTGCYIGGHVGWGKSQATDKVQFDDVTADETEHFFNNNYSTSGAVYGVHGGCNYQTGRYVVGIEGDYSWSSRTNDNLNFPLGADSASFSTRLDNLASIRGRAGIADDRLLLYVTAGAAWAKFNYSFVLNDSDTTTNAASLSFSPNGMVFGAGMEYAMTNQIILRAEYLHYTFGQQYGLPALAVVGPSVTDNVSFKTVDVIRVGASYLFNWGSPLVTK
jgi:outer membrane immunogenic protein